MAESSQCSGGLDVRKLDGFLREILPDVEGDIAVERIPGGQSNPTFFVSYPNRRLVLRKQPAGNVLPSAHAIDREYRILGALTASAVPVPNVVAFCEDSQVLGTPFYLMDRLEGRVFSSCGLEGVTPDERRAMFLSMARTMAALHAIDWKALGLDDFGRPGNYFTRQIDRWARQWHATKSGDVPEMDVLLKWLSANRPSDMTTVICHGDFRIGNLMFHPTEPCVIGVLDWELSTLGHPLADVAYSALAWHLSTDEYMGMRGLPLNAMGIPTENEYLRAYYAASGRPLRVEPFHYAFSLFRLAVIFEGIGARARQGNAASDTATDVAKLSVKFAQRAVQIIGAR